MSILLQGDTSVINGIVRINTRSYREGNNYTLFNV